MSLASYFFPNSVVFFISLLLPAAVFYQSCIIFLYMFKIFEFYCVRFICIQMRVIVCLQQFTQVKIKY